MPSDKSGHIVWHDLFTANQKRSMAFYRHIADWSFETEHATDFAWGGGEKDFFLALSANEAGAGFAETPQGMSNGWIAYVEVPHVDSVAERAESLGGTIVRLPFEVPGVGRNALLRDPLGALIGISYSRHDFPVPQRQFGVEIYLSDAAAFPEEFYSQLFNWKTSLPHGAKPIGDMIIGPSDELVALHLSGKLPTDEQAIWVPSIKVDDMDDAKRAAKAMDASLLSGSVTENTEDCRVFIRDPDGGYSCLSKAQSNAP